MRITSSFRMAAKSAALLLASFSSTRTVHGFSSSSRLVRSVVVEKSKSSSSQLWSSDAAGDYYGESAGSYMVKEFAEYEQLEEIVKLASSPLPERPDGIVAVAKFSSATLDACKATEAEYERLARDNPATIFLRCFQEYDNSHILIGKANIQNWPTFDIFYQGNRVARVESSNHAELQEVLERYQFQNTKLDLFSETAENAWGDRDVKADMNATPRTTARFIPGYDWNSAKGFFDEAGDKAVKSFEETFENWIPDIDDDDDDDSNDNKKK